MNYALNQDLSSPLGLMALAPGVIAHLGAAEENLTYMDKQ